MKDIREFIAHHIFVTLLFLVLRHQYLSRSQYIHRATKYSYCCNQISEYPSCQKACEQVSLLLPKDIRYQKLPNVHLLCPAHLEKFWSCMNSVLQAVDQAYGWLGWPCCNLALSQNCFISCVTSTSKSQLYKSCRQSEELTFYQCLKKQEEGEICCSNTANQECKQSCWRIFKKESSPTQDDKLNVQRKCGTSNKHVMRCIQNYTRTTPARNPAENLKCCQESSNATCRERCRQILLNSTTEQEIVDKLIENCGEALPNNALWQCFIRNSEVNDANGKKDTDDLFDSDANDDMMMFHEDDNSDDSHGLSFASRDNSQSLGGDNGRRDQSGQSHNTKDHVRSGEGVIYESNSDHRRHPTSKLDIAGMDAVKLQCCSKAVTQICMDLCVKSYSIEANNNWNEFSEHCQYNPVETNLVTCLSEVDEPCTLGCENLQYCGDLFNTRDVELFRSCKKGSDRAAKDLMTVWGSTSTISLPMLDIPVHDINLCSPNEWRAIACVLEIKPCHPRTHTSLICRSDCLEILSKCVNRDKLLPGQSPEGLCNILSPVDPDQPCISVSDYMNYSDSQRNPTRHSTLTTNQINLRNQQQHNLDLNYGHSEGMIEDGILNNDIWEGGGTGANDGPTNHMYYGDGLKDRLSSWPSYQYWRSLVTSIIPVKRFRGSVCKHGPCGKEELCTADRSLACTLALGGGRSPNDPKNYEVPYVLDDDGIEFEWTTSLNSARTLSCFGTTTGPKPKNFEGRKGGGDSGSGKDRRKQRNARKNSIQRNVAAVPGNYTCRAGCTLGEVSAYVVPQGSYVQLPINGKSLNCPRVCFCSTHNELIRCIQLPCSGINHCWIQDSVKLHLSQFLMECNFCACFNGKTTCTLRYCPSVFWTEEERLSYTGLPCNCPPHFVPVCATNGRTYPSACVARCSGFSDDSFEYGSCPSVGSQELGNVCNAIGGPGSYNPCGAKSPATISSSGIMCLPLRQICLSSPIENYRPALKLLDDNPRIPISTCPQYLCVDKRLECNSQAGNSRSQAICSLFRDNDYHLLTNPQPQNINKESDKFKSHEPTWKCLRKMDPVTMATLRETRENQESSSSPPTISYDITFTHNGPSPNQAPFSTTFEAIHNGPVCGYDGETYPDECRAIISGALIDYPGPCRSIGVLRPRNPLNPLAFSDDTNPSSINSNEFDPICRNVICPKQQRYYEWVLPSANFMRFHTQNNYYDSKQSRRSDHKIYRITCIGVTPPGACCPVCAAEIRVLYSQETADALAKDSEYGPVTVNQITSKLRRHLAVPECDIYGYLSIERDLVFLVVPVVPNTLIKNGPPSATIKIRRRRKVTKYMDESPKQNKYSDKLLRSNLVLFMVQDRTEDEDDIDFMTGVDYKNGHFDSGKFSYDASPVGNLSSKRLGLKPGVDEDAKLVIIPRAPFPFSPLHVEACNREAQRLSALISSHNPTLNAELPMSILLGSTVRSSFATTTITNSATNLKVGSDVVGLFIVSSAITWLFLHSALSHYITTLVLLR